MSYAKAMKHARNVRKCRKMRNMYMGFDTGSGSWPSFRATPYGGALCEVRDWWPQRHDGDAAKRQYNRECIREAITRLRAAKLDLQTRGIEP